MHENLTNIVETLGIGKIKCHIFLCCESDQAKMLRKSAESLKSWNYLKKRLKGLKFTGEGGIYRTKVNCLQIYRQ